MDFSDTALGLCSGTAETADRCIRMMTVEEWKNAEDFLPSGSTAWLEAQDFAPTTGKIARIPDSNGAPGDFVIGADGNNDAWAWSAFAETCDDGRYYPADAKGGALGLESQACAVFGWVLGQYAYKLGTHAKSARNAMLLLENTGAFSHKLVEARAILWARSLIDMPANILGPEALESDVKARMQDLGADVTVIRGDKLLEEGFPGIHVVGNGSSQAPRLLEAVWGDKDAPEVTIIGKGVTFDTGGLNIKAFAGIRHMKRDMGGAAVAVGLAAAIIGLSLPVRLRLLVPIVENVIGKDAFRPGDILSTRSGKTIEVENTDCEGRIILSDCLTLATESSPDVIIDCGTLTGSARTAFGSQIQAMFTPDDALADEITKAGVETDDAVWRMPLWDGYASRVRGAVGDLINMAPGAYAGAITAALFLREFTEDHPRWIHLDISAWNDTKRPGRPVGGEATGVRALLLALTRRYKND